VPVRPFEPTSLPSTRMPNAVPAPVVRSPWIASPGIGFATRTPLRMAAALAWAAALAPIGDRVAIA
jgi:hypothetical protein